MRNEITEINHKKVLIIKMDAIGDYILWLDVAKELRKVYPSDEYKITLLGNQQWIELATVSPFFDVVWSIDRPSIFINPSNSHELVSKLCRVTFDVVLHPVYSREFLFGDLFVLASDAKVKIGMQGDSFNLSWWQKRVGDLCYTDIVPALSDHEDELEHNAQLMRWLGLAEFKATIPRLEGSFELPAKQLPADYFVIIAGASVSLRMWPILRFIVLIERVYEQTGLTAVVCGCRSEEHLGNTLEMGTSAPNINLTGQTSLSELAAVISKAQFIIANETGGLHIAAALGVPSVCIVGGGHFGRFIPYKVDTIIVKQLPVPVFNEMECFGCNWNCIYCIPLEGAAPCIEAVTFESVFSAVMELVSK